MNRSHTHFERLARMASFLTPCLVAAALFSCVCAPGCGRRAKRREARRLARLERQNQNVAQQPRPETNPTLTPEGLFREMIYVYANAKYYSDSGYVEFLCETEPTRQTRSYRIPCSVSIAKPNYLRVNLGASRLLSDGQTMRAEILGETYKNQKLETPAPLVVASIKELYPDASFAESANLGVPSNLFWTSPQLVLLFAKDPKKTFVPEGAKLKLLEPKYLQFDEKEKRLECDRLQIAAEDGARVLWIARETKTLVRCELPVEQTAAPFNDAKIVAARIDFPMQVVSDAPFNNIAEFALSDKGADDRLVEKFLPPELLPLNRVFPIEALVKFHASSEDDPAPLESGKTTLLYFWRADDASSRNFNAYQAFVEATNYSFDSSRLQFAAVNVDKEEPSEETLERSIVSGLRVPSMRLDSNAALKSAPDFPEIEAPTLLLLNEQGLVVKCIRDSFSFVQLQKLLTRALEGRDVSSDDFNAYYVGARRFIEFIDESDARDLYRSAADFADPISAPTRAFPKTFGLRECWRSEGLFSPMNPLAVMKPLADQTTEPLPTPVSEADDEFAPLAQKDQTPDELVVVPCDGNALALLSTSGQLIRKTSPVAAQGEPIGFVRSIDYGSGKRYYAASARNQSRKLHRFDENFLDLGSLDVGGLSGLFVGDALFADVDDDGTPELILSLLSDPFQSGAQTNGVYCVDMKTQKILWKYKSILSPHQLGLLVDPVDGRLRLFATDYVEGKESALAELDPRGGEKIDEIRATPGDSICSFAASAKTPVGTPKIVAIVTNPETNRSSLVGIGPNDQEEWKIPVPNAPDTTMQRIAALDLNYDGYDEWAVASPDGVVLFFDAKGTPLDSFQYGEELAGICSASWDGETYLIVADLKKVSAWKFETRRPRKAR